MSLIPDASLEKDCRTLTKTWRNPDITSDFILTGGLLNLQVFPLRLFFSVLSPRICDFEHASSTDATVLASSLHLLSEGNLRPFAPELLPSGNRSRDVAGFDATRIFLIP
jgi:hypothetical protein